MYHLLYELTHGEADAAARRQLETLPISAGLRGWNHAEEAFRPPFPEPCLTMSDILGVPGGMREKHLDPNRISGDLFHSLYSKMIRLPVLEAHVISKRSRLITFIQSLPGRQDEIVKEIVEGSTCLQDGLAAGTVDESWVSKRSRELAVTWDHEMRLMAATATYHLVAYPNHSVGTIMSRCVPFVSEDPIDASRLILSRNLQVDARLTHRAPMVVDLKTGPVAKVNRIAVAGYALAVECEDRTPIELGCVYYSNVPDSAAVPNIQCDVFAVTDALRSEFISRRNTVLVARNEHGGATP